MTDWLADDNGDAIFEVNPTTGASERRIPQADFNAAPRFGGGAQAGANSTEDFESFAYDVNSDTLYLFSGLCCSSSTLPTAFRLTRKNGTLQMTDWQPLASTADLTGAAWNPGDDRVYVGKGRMFRSFDYATAAQGPTLSVTGVSGITLWTSPRAAQTSSSSSAPPEVATSLAGRPPPVSAGRGSGSSSPHALRSKVRHLPAAGAQAALHHLEQLAVYFVGNDSPKRWFNANATTSCSDNSGWSTSPTSRDQAPRNGRSPTPGRDSGRIRAELRVPPDGARGRLRRLLRKELSPEGGWRTDLRTAASNFGRWSNG